MPPSRVQRLTWMVHDVVGHQPHFAAHLWRRRRVRGVVVPRLPIQVYTVEGGSMLPSVQNGDRIVSTRTPTIRPRRGTLVLYHPPDTEPRAAGTRRGERR